MVGLLEQHRVRRGVAAQHVAAHLGAAPEIVQTGVEQRGRVRGEHGIRPRAVHGVVHDHAGLGVGDHEAAAGRGGLGPGEQAVVGGEGDAQHPPAVLHQHALAGQQLPGDGDGDAGRAAHGLAVADAGEGDAVQRVGAVDVPPAVQQHRHRQLLRDLVREGLREAGTQRRERGGGAVGVRVLGGEVLAHLGGADAAQPLEGQLGGVAEEDALRGAGFGAGGEEGLRGVQRGVRGGGDEVIGHRSGVPLGVAGGGGSRFRGVSAGRAPAGHCG